MRRFRCAVASLAVAWVCVGSALPAATAGDWQKLFNGTSLEGWEVVSGPGGSWGVENGVLYTTGTGGGWLSTTREFADFELQLEFRVPPGGNSGVFLRSPHMGDPAYTGLEVQVLDDAAPEYADLKPTQYTGSVYDVAAAMPRATKPAGEWQRLEIRCHQRQVSVKVNGTAVVSANLDEHQDQYAAHPGLERTRGFVGFQNHGARVEYRAVELRELE